MLSIRPSASKLSNEETTMAETDKKDVSYDTDSGSDIDEGEDSNIEVELPDGILKREKSALGDAPRIVMFFQCKVCRDLAVLRYKCEKCYFVPMNWYLHEK